MGFGDQGVGLLFGVVLGAGLPGAFDGVAGLVGTVGEHFEQHGRLVFVVVEFGEPSEVFDGQLGNLGSRAASEVAADGGKGGVDGVATDFGAPGDRGGGGAEQGELLHGVQGVGGGERGPVVVFHELGDDPAGFVVAGVGVDHQHRHGVEPGRVGGGGAAVAGADLHTVGGADRDDGDDDAVVADAGQEVAVEVEVGAYVAVGVQVGRGQVFQGAVRGGGHSDYFLSVGAVVGRCVVEMGCCGWCWAWLAGGPGWISPASRAG